MPSNDSTTAEPAANRRTLGMLWIVYAVLRVVCGIFLIFFAPTATVMFGALLSRVADPFTLMANFHIFYTAGIVLAFVCGAFALVAGLLLLAGSRSARALALVAAFLSLSEIPLGLTLGTYTLVVLIPSRSV